MMLVQ